MSVFNASFNCFCVFIFNYNLQLHFNYIILYYLLRLFQNTFFHFLLVQICICTTCMIYVLYKITDPVATLRCRACYNHPSAKLSYQAITIFH